MPLKCSLKFSIDRLRNSWKIRRTLTPLSVCGYGPYCGTTRIRSLWSQAACTSGRMVIEVAQHQPGLRCQLIDQARSHLATCSVGRTDYYGERERDAAHQPVGCRI